MHPDFVPSKKSEPAKRPVREDPMESTGVTPEAKREKSTAPRRMECSHPEGQFPRAQWRYVDAALALATFSVLKDDPGAPPS